MKLVASILSEDICKHGESIWWDDDAAQLYWLDCEGQTIYTYNLANGIKYYKLDFNLMALVPNQDNGYIAATEREIVVLDNSYQVKKIIYKLPSNYKGRFNDCKCGPDGAFYAGTVGEIENTGKLYRIDLDGQVETILDNVGISNGIVWNQNNNVVYYTDSVDGKIYSYDFENGILTNPKVIFEYKGQLPDGMCLDEDDHIWIAMWGLKKVLCIDTEQGQIICEIEVDAINPSSVTFGGKDRKTLYITTSRLGLSKTELEEYPFSGCLHYIDLDVIGAKMWKGRFNTVI